MSYKHLFELSQDKSFCDAVMVNYSGEIGAKQIYLGQIKAAKTLNLDSQKIQLLIKMLEGEIEHYEYFSSLIQSSPQFKPSLINAIWQPLGFAIGYLSVIASFDTGMLLTEKVETVIEAHYKDQIKQFSQSNFYNSEQHKDFVLKVQKFLEEEIEHKHIGYENSLDINKNIRFILGLVFTYLVKGAIVISSNV
jgi:ubiquinone biosynthesis monooxygenase Coq7